MSGLRPRLLDRVFKKALDYMFFRRGRSLREVLRSLKKCNRVEAIEGVLQECRCLLDKGIGRMTPIEFGLVSQKLYAEGIRVPRISDESKRRAQKLWKRRGRSRKRRSNGRR